jgi:hypothetical protein
MREIQGAGWIRLVILTRILGDLRLGRTFTHRQWRAEDVPVSVASRQRYVPLWLHELYSQFTIKQIGSFLIYCHVGFKLVFSFVF